MINRNITLVSSGHSVSALANELNASLSFPEYRNDNLLSACLPKVEQFCQLESNWDSYGAQPISSSAASGAVYWLNYLAQFDIPAPDIFPMHNGNIQVEWSEFGLDIEIEIISISTCDISFEDLSEDESWEKSCSSDLSSLDRAVNDLASRYANSLNKAPGLRLVV